MARCKAMVDRRRNQKGGVKAERCKAAALKGKPFCVFHTKMPSKGSRQMDRIREQIRRRRKK